MLDVNDPRFRAVQRLIYQAAHARSESAWQRLTGRAHAALGELRRSGFFRGQARNLRSRRVAAVIVALFLALISMGCQATTDRQAAVIAEGVALVRGWQPDGPARALAKSQFLEDAAPFVAPSPSPLPTPGGN